MKFNFLTNLIFYFLFCYFFININCPIRKCFIFIFVHGATAYNLVGKGRKIQFTPMTSVFNMDTALSINGTLFIFYLVCDFLIYSISDSSLSQNKVCKKFVCFPHHNKCGHIMDQYVSNIKVNIYYIMKCSQILIT